MFAQNYQKFKNFYYMRKSQTLTYRFSKQKFSVKFTLLKLGESLTFKIKKIIYFLFAKIN